MSFKTLVLSILMFSYPCLGIIYSVSTFVNSQGRQVTLLEDIHFVGSKNQNLMQLEEFLAKIERTNKARHMLVESKYFFYYPGSANLSDFYKRLSAINLRSNKWSYTVSPQKAQACTWIAWELPHRLLSIKLENLSYDFCDPRLLLEPSLFTIEGANKVWHYVEELRNRMLGYCPNSLLEQFEKYEDVFDEVLRSKIIAVLFDESLDHKDIDIICGGFHGKIFPQLLASLGFENKRQDGISSIVMSTYKFGDALNDRDYGKAISLMSLLE